MKSFRFRLLVAALAILLGSAIAKSQTADAPAPPPMHEHGHGFGMARPPHGILRQATEPDRRPEGADEDRHAKRASHHEAAVPAGTPDRSTASRTM